MALCCTLFFILSAAAAVVVLAKQNTVPSVSRSEGDMQYDKADNSIDKTVFTGTVLPEGPDAGAAYLEETLFIGDSNTVRMYAYGMVPLENYMGEEGMGVEGVTGVRCVYFKNDPSVYTIPGAIAKVQPRRIVMTFGTNDASGQMSQENFIAAYKKAIAAIQKEYPYCDIIINAIPPVAKVRSYPDITMQTVDRFNKALVQMAKELGLPFLDTSEVLRGEDGFAKADYMIEDGLHLRKAAVYAILNYVRTHPYETEDRRPAVGNVPARKAAPIKTQVSSEPDVTVPEAPAPDTGAPAPPQESVPPPASSSTPAPSVPPPETPSSSAPPPDTGTGAPPDAGTPLPPDAGTGAPPNTAPPAQPSPAPPENAAPADETPQDSAAAQSVLQGAQAAAESKGVFA